MTVEYAIQTPYQYPHEAQAVLRLAQAMQRAFAASDQFYLLAANVRFWRAQVDALVLSPGAITALELKSCSDPVYGRADGPWRVMGRDHKGRENRVRGGSHENPYRQVLAIREMLIKYLDRNRRRFLNGSRIGEMAHRWGHVSAAVVFSPHLHPDSDVVVPPESRAWLGVVGLNEVTEFLFSRASPQIDLHPQELRCLATQALHCHPWTDIEALLPASPSHGYLWLLDETGHRTYAFPVADETTIGRSRDNVLVVPRRFHRTSRHHACIHVGGEDVLLHDSDSTHGTFVNGEPVTAEGGRQLHEGDRIALGDVMHPDTCHLRFEQRAQRDTLTEPTSGTRP